MQVQFHNLDENNNLKFVVVQARYKGKWIFVRHSKRLTWEIPGGHIDPGENVDNAAKRELWEESGAQEFDLIPICDYSVNRNGEGSYGRLYFAEVKTIGKLPEHEIEEVSFCDILPTELTYELIQPFLFEKVLETINK